MIEGKPCIVVAQTYQKVINDLKKQVSPYSPNHIIYTTNPGDVLCELMINPVDIVISGQHFYQSDLNSLKEIISLCKKVATEGAYELIDEHYKPPISGPQDGSELCKEIHRINPDVSVFRFSLTPGMIGGFAGDIPKFGNYAKIVEFLESPFLSYACNDRDWEILIKLFPDIRFYEQNLR